MKVHKAKTTPGLWQLQSTCPERRRLVASAAHMIPVIIKEACINMEDRLRATTQELKLCHDEKIASTSQLQTELSSSQEREHCLTSSLKSSEKWCHQLLEENSQLKNEVATVKKDLLELQEKYDNGSRREEVTRASLVNVVRQRDEWEKNFCDLEALYDELVETKEELELKIKVMQCQIDSLSDTPLCSLFEKLHLHDECSQKEVIDSYRNLSRVLHPDKRNAQTENTESHRVYTEQFQLLTQAYELLKDDATRAFYKTCRDIEQTKLFAKNKTNSSSLSISYERFSSSCSYDFF